MYGTSPVTSIYSYELPQKCLGNGQERPGKYLVNTQEHATHQPAEPVPAVVRELLIPDRPPLKEEEHGYAVAQPRAVGVQGAGGQWGTQSDAAQGRGKRMQH